MTDNQSNLFLLFNQYYTLDRMPHTGETDAKKEELATQIDKLLTTRQR